MFRAIARVPVAVIPIALFAISACGTEPTSAAPAVNRLSRMIEAEWTQRYEGIKVVSFATGGGERVRNLYVDWKPGGKSVVERLGVAAGRRRTWRTSRPRLYWLKDRALLLRNYVVVENGPEKVAGRPCDSLLLRSRHPGRPSMRMLVDAETGLLLDFTKYDYEGRRTFRSRFTSIRIRPSMPSAPGRGSGGGALASAIREPRTSSGVSEKERTVDFAPFRAGLLPRGFAQPQA